jgi:aromatase
MTVSTTREVEHAIAIDAPASRVYDLIVDVERWRDIFGPTVHVEYVEKDDSTERIRIWATANDTAKTWVSRRTLDAGKRRVAFRQEQSQHPVGGMGGLWAVEPLSEATCQVRLFHDYFAASDDPADLDWIGTAVDKNSKKELAALKASAELSGPDKLITFDDVVDVEGSAKDVYDFLNEAQLWQERLPHVAAVSLQEETPGLQILEMDTRTKDGSLHTTRSVRVCQPYHKIVYKQTVLPALMTLHTGHWLIEERSGGQVSVTSRHTVKINSSRVTEILGADADVAAAQAFVRGALSANSLATLRLAKAYAEGGDAGQEGPA